MQARAHLVHPKHPKGVRVEPHISCCQARGRSRSAGTLCSSPQVQADCRPHFSACSCGVAPWLVYIASYVRR